jgi:hypothetical protein
MYSLLYKLIIIYKHSQPVGVNHGKQPLLTIFTLTFKKTRMILSGMMVGVAESSGFAKSIFYIFSQNYFLNTQVYKPGSVPGIYYLVNKRIYIHPYLDNNIDSINLDRRDREGVAI